MSELTLTLIQMGFLALLWVFAFAIASAIRADLFGVRPRSAAPPTPAAQPASPAPAQPPAKPVKLSRSAPTRLVVIEGGDSGRATALNGPLTVGRGEGNDLPLTDEYVSTRHARLVPHNGQWYVEDLGSTNGTYVAGARISRPTPVGAKSTVRVGRTVMELRK